ncbi:MAG: proline--tRNA ligase [Spirochaetes bacterium]|nr:proline--tRNA ligase [Spirochaetota bacterium]
MRMSHLFVPTLKEEPAEAVITSHKLMIRAALIRKLAAGLYSYLPLGLKVFKKVENIIREEMDKAGAQEFSLPILTPAELWQETQRWDVFGPELMRIRDRQDHDFALGPTHEEVFTDIVRQEISSYKQLPVNFYQIKTKFRDEIRPRFGVMRCREFTMKDAYSFDIDEKGLDRSYKAMRKAYENIFKRCGLNTVIVQADVGAMGGTQSEEFMVVSDVGEEVLVLCPSCGYAANLEKAESRDGTRPAKSEKIAKMAEVDTPDVKTIEDLTGFFKTAPGKFIKTIICLSDGNPIAVLARGDIEINETKLKNAVQSRQLELADEKTIEKVTKAPVGFAGPVGLKNIMIYADESVKGIVNGITGANKKDRHLKNVNLDRDYKVDKFIDVRKAAEGDLCAKCSKKLSFKRGIEVGHIFKLGLKYTKSMDVKFLDKDQKEKLPIMGCYGIGVDRTVAAIIEQSSDQDGIIWPITVAPFEIIIIALNVNEKKVKDISEKLYHNLSRSFQVLFEDRDLSPGFKFKDADLIGCPIKIIISEKNLQNDQVEVKTRRTRKVESVPLKDLETKIKELIDNEYKSFQV